MSGILKIKEQFSWILDKYGYISVDEYQENIDFVHSLGKKCDCVGWSNLDMDEPDAMEILDKIQTFCKENGWHARGWYERTYTDYESDWYELKTEDFKDNTISDRTLVETQNGKELYLDIINAYHEINISPKEYGAICVPDRFRKACIDNGITDVDFCWVQDKGRYETEQYFYIFPQQSIPWILHDRTLNHPKQTERINKLGGHLPEIAAVFHSLQRISLQDCYLKEDMPDGGIAYVYYPSDFNFCGRYKILIHKDTAEMLINAKALSSADITPAFITDKYIPGYDIEETEEAPKPLKAYMASSLKEYKNLKAKGRPEYIVKEKDALKFLRKTKGERKSDFNKKLSKKYVEEISGSVYNSILPYYQVCDGALLSDEYTFLSYADSLKATEEFFKNISKEELLMEKPDGIVIATCADGDFVLFTKNEKVIRFSHEAPDIISEWQNIAKFFVQAINDSE